MLLARKKRKRAGEILESLIPSAMFEETSSNSDESDIDTNSKPRRVSRLIQKRLTR
jgi:hypothetical protein